VRKIPTLYQRTEERHMIQIISSGLLGMLATVLVPKNSTIVD
jgi:hypothetical protein